MNKAIIKVRQSYILSLLVCATSLSAMTLLIPIKWLGVFIRLGDLNLYRLTFFILVILSFLMIRGSQKHKKIPTIALVGFVIGSISSFFAMFVMTVALPDGIERINNSIKDTDYIDILSIYFMQTLILGGWLFGMILSIFLRIVYVGLEE